MTQQQERIRRLCTDHGLPNVCEAAGVTAWAVQNWCNGRNLPSRPTAEKLAQAFGGLWPDYTLANEDPTMIADLVRYFEDLHQAEPTDMLAASYAARLRRMLREMATGKEAI